MIAPLRAACPPALDLVAPMPYVALQSMLDETAPHGWRYYDRLHYLPEVGDGLHRRRWSAAFEQVPTPHSHVMTGWMGGAIDRVAPGATAFGHRDARALTWLIGCSGEEPLDAAAEWVRRAWDEHRPLRARRGLRQRAERRAPGRATPTPTTIWERLARGQAPLRPGRRVRRGNGIG